MSNILEPLVNAVFSYGEWIYNTCFKSYDFNFNDYFKCVNLKNNQDQYPKLIKDYEGVKGRVFLFNIPIGLSKNDFDKHKEGLEAQLKENRDKINKWIYGNRSTNEEVKRKDRLQASNKS